MVPIFSSIFKDQQVLGVFSEHEIFIFPDSYENIPATSSGIFLLSRINCSKIDSALTLVFNELQLDGIICILHAGIFFVFCCVVTKELLQKEDPLNQNIQLFSIYFFFSDFTSNPESRDIEGKDNFDGSKLLLIAPGLTAGHIRKFRTPSTGLPVSAV